MSVELSKWLLEGIDESELETTSDVAPLATDDAYVVYGNAYGNTYLAYSDYYNYYNYSDYYNYYNYSNSISVTRHPISQSALLNEIVTFSVGASNTIDSCQWYVADSVDGAGTAITGATSPSYSVSVTPQVDGKYYYCVVKRGSNSSTSNRALLTLMSVSAFDIYVAMNDHVNMLFVRATPPTTEIVSTVVADESIATVSNTGEVIGVSQGVTTCTVTGSNGATATFKITVLPDTPVNRQVAIFSNVAIAIREYKGISRSIYPSQMAPLLGSMKSVYTTVEEIYTEIANMIREKDGSTDPINPHEFYYRILQLTTL